MKGKYLIDITEIFRLINGEKKYRTVKLAFYFVLIIIVIVRYSLLYGHRILAACPFFMMLIRLMSALISLIEEEDGVHESVIL
ncbi:hypothetical protein HHK36_017718 [Tetracentron sinense]|uniref:Uncharacterized protein n=1 Tax=Tetracentron sinense TaxID=13715 RepID=A0A835DAL7_TETSI|nr:hypothetical protein HHK36_017718 [Tetracentron sinense]